MKLAQKKNDEKILGVCVCVSVCVCVCVRQRVDARNAMNLVPLTVYRFEVAAIDIDMHLMARLSRRTCIVTRCILSYLFDHRGRSFRSGPGSSFLLLLLLLLLFLNRSAPRPTGLRRVPPPAGCFFSLNTHTIKKRTRNQFVELGLKKKKTRGG